MVQCPHCRHEMQIKGAKMGQLYPTCPKCATRFVVVIEQEGAEPLVLPDTEDAQATRPRPDPRPRPNGNSHARPASSRPSAPTDDSDPIDIAPPATPPVASRPSPRPMPSPAADRPTMTDPEAFTLQENAPKVYQQTTGRAPVAERGPAIRAGVLGDYELKRRLGQGGMGTAYLARQVSMDRDVAIKVLDPNLTRDVQFLARFVRDGFAAAQLAHHNIVQIYDFCEEQDSRFYTMEYVKGRSLAEVIRNDGAIAPDTAAGYILQAARGLKLAHNQGMLHRDIKPENLLLSEDGIVKVADLGVARPAGTAMEAPDSSGAGNTDSAAYIAPEQAADPETVDGRADIYALGCVLFALLTGRPPFEGRSAEAVLRLAALDEVPTPLKYNPHIPSELGRICRKMTAKKREGRYPNMGMLIRDLERYLGVEAAGGFTPRQQHIEDLERCVKAYHDSNLATMRKVLYWGSGFFGLVIASSMCWAGRWWYAAAVAGLVVCTFLFYQLMVELSGQRYFLGKAKQAVRMLTWGQWTQVIVSGLLLVLAAIAMAIVLPTLAVLAGSFVLALIARQTVDRMVTRQRHGSFAQTESMLRGFRIQGLDEESIRRFVCEYSGHYWEEFYEEMFGYEAKMEARQRWGRTMHGRLRPKFAPWRDPLVQWIDRKVQRQQQEKQRRLLLNAQIRALRGQGSDELSAGKEAKRMAEVMLSQAAGMRDDAQRYREDPASATPADPAKQQLVQRPRDPFNFDVESEKAKTPAYLEQPHGSPSDWLLGPRARFAVAAVLLLGFLVWQMSNRSLVQEQLRVMANERIDPTLRAVQQQQIQYMPLSDTLPWLPQFLCDAAGSWNGGAAGAVLLISSFIPGTVIAIPMYIAAVIMLFGHWPPILNKIPIGDPPIISLLMGLSLALLTFVFARKQT